ncbi:hypothetical protein ACFL59_08035 [Planctomycetota bacterium]
MTFVAQRPVAIASLALLLSSLAGCAGPNRQVAAIDGFFGLQSRVTITSKPSSAAVKIMGIDVGTTPVNVDLDTVRTEAAAQESVVKDFFAIFLFLAVALPPSVIRGSVEDMDIVRVSHAGYQPARVSPIGGEGLRYGRPAFQPDQRVYHFDLMTPDEVPVILSNY